MLVVRGRDAGVRGRDAGSGGRFPADVFWSQSNSASHWLAGMPVPLPVGMRGRSFAPAAANRYNDTRRGRAASRSRFAANGKRRHGNQTVHPSPQTDLWSVATDPFGPGDLQRYRG